MEHLITSPEILGNIIKTERQKAGLTQKELGEKLAMDQATISNIERGSPGTRLDTILHLLSCLDLGMGLYQKKASSESNDGW